MSALNALNFAAPPDGSWATTNLAEALPGVATPLGWSIWAVPSDQAARAPFAAMGAIPASALRYPERAEDRVVNLFYGRIAIRVDFFCEMGDLVPGATGEAVARDAFGFVPPGFVSHASKRRWPHFLAQMPLTFRRTPGAARAILADNQRWCDAQIPRVETLDLAATRNLYREAARRFEQAIVLQANAIACVIQPVYTALQKITADAGIDGARLMRGLGSHEEDATIADLWSLSREQLTSAQFIARHGYLGPDVGEISSASWREDPTPVLALADGYRALSDGESPHARARAGAAERARAEQQLLAAVGPGRRGAVRLVLRLAHRHIPLRSVAKLAYLRAMDAARAAARRAGTLMAQSGVLETPEDVFYLTGEELLGALPGDPRAVVADRRALRAHYRGLELPVHWTGPPVATPIDADSGRGIEQLSGFGVSPGVVEGRVRIIEDPAVAEMEAGEILVAHTTDPSWASVMFMAAALVVDIGGQLSHAAVVARELGVPCVMNTGIGTRALRTGDVCRVDGSAGTVQVVTRTT